MIYNKNNEKSKKTICLNMIVKNESHIIEKTLENLCYYIDFDAYYISDTGSTDNTMDLIRAFFKKRNIPGHIEQVEWRDFGFNRTLALQMARNGNTSSFNLLPRHWTTGK